MPECKKCHSDFPRVVVIDGKRRNLQRRTYCFGCSPFGNHNTRVLERVKERKSQGVVVKVCPTCTKEHIGPANKCAVCYFRQRKKQVAEKVAKIVGRSCWICGYGKTKNSLCFHHVSPENKKFQLSTRELMYKWERVYAEMHKCVFVCMNCHGEIHDGLISKTLVEKMRKAFWSKHDRGLNSVGRVEDS